MKKYFAIQRLIMWITRELSYEVVISRTHRERDKRLAEIVRHIVLTWEQIASADEDAFRDMDDIPF